MTSVHDNNFDALRFFGALLVLWGHTFTLTGGVPPATLAMSLNTLGVKIFFVISGFLIAKSWRSDPSVVRFAQRRALRVFPALIGVVLFSALIIGPLFTDLPLDQYFRHPHFWSYFQNIALRIHYALPAVFTDTPIPHAVNGSLWTLPVEIVAYMAVPIVLSVTALLRRIPMSVAALLLSVTGAIIALDIWGRFQPVETQASWTVYATNWLVSLQLVSYFFIGLCIAVLRLERFMTYWMALALIVLAVVIPWRGMWAFLPAFFVIPVAVLAFSLSPRIALFDPLSRYGDLSYGLYLYAYPVQQAVSSVTGITHPTAHFALSAAITLVLAAGSWHLIEKQALKLKPTERSGPARMPDLAAVPY